MAVVDIGHTIPHSGHLESATLTLDRRFPVAKEMAERGHNLRHCDSDTFGSETSTLSAEDDSEVYTGGHTPLRQSQPRGPREASTRSTIPTVDPRVKIREQKDFPAEQWDASCKRNPS